MVFEKILDNFGDEYQKEKELLKERKLYEAFQSLKDRKDLNSLFFKALIYILLKQNKKAIEILENILKNDFKGIPLWLQYELLGTILYEEKRYLESANYLIKSLKEDKNNFYSLYNLANIHIINKNYKEAYVILQKIQEIEPYNPNIKRNIAIIEKGL